MPIKYQVGDKIKHYLFGTYTIIEILPRGQVRIVGALSLHATGFLYPSTEFEDKHIWPIYIPSKPKVKTCQ